MVEIYLITNLLNNKKYVGKTVRGYKLRFEEHCKFKDSYIGNAINKYGRNNFKVQLIDTVNDDDWQYWETYYIRYYKSHFTEGGYNVTWGGDNNPMDIPEIRKKQKEACNTKEAKERYSKQAIAFNKSEKRKEAQLKLNELYKTDAEYRKKVLSGFKKYNDSRKIKVAKTDENGNILKVYDSLSDAVAEFGKDVSYTSAILRFADKFNKNGKRAKFLGCYWTTKGLESVSTIPVAGKYS